MQQFIFMLKHVFGLIATFEVPLEGKGGKTYFGRQIPPYGTAIPAAILTLCNPINSKG